ncbi:hypothetical protein OO184_19205 [Photorhabdus sp. APURE]|nr:hypothetical protein [Photorhabdus aballayi]
MLCQCSDLISAFTGLAGLEFTVAMQWNGTGYRPIRATPFSTVFGISFIVKQSPQ